MYLYALEGRAQDHVLPARRPATRINQTTTTAPTDAPSRVVGPRRHRCSASKGFTDAEAVACSLENPETCEACD